MSKAKGLMRTCDRCGKWVFLKRTGEGVVDGGYTRWDEFEPAPDGWENIKGVGDVCDECKMEYEDMLERYKKRLPREERHDHQG